MKGAVCDICERYDPKTMSRAKKQIIGTKHGIPIITQRKIEVCYECLMEQKREEGQK